MRGLILGCLYGGGSILFGAILTHALNDSLQPKELNTLSIAAKYLFYVAVPLLILGVSQPQWHWPTRLFNLFILSGLLFSGSLILLVITKIKFFALLTPIGGGMMIASWGYFLYLGIKRSQ